jgi:hypothetical protein
MNVQYTVNIKAPVNPHVSYEFFFNDGHAQAETYQKQQCEHTKEV